MSLKDIPIESIDQDHLQNLIDSEAPEAQSIDYKKQTYGSNDAAKTEFLADISSFANSSGGDLIIGIAASAGKPTAFAPFEEDADAEQLRLEHMARSGIEPRIANLQTRAISIQSGGAVIIVRIPRSYSAPHRIIFQGKNKFWARSSVGKYEPGIDELRSMFNFAPQMAERMQRFRMERVAKIASGEIGIKLKDDTFFTLHIVPFSHFDFSSPISIDGLYRAYTDFPPLGSSQALARKINIDGLQTFSVAENIVRAYVQVFGTGALEAVASSIIRNDKAIDVQHLVKMFLPRLRRYLLALSANGVQPPFVVMCSLLGVKGKEILAKTPQFMDDREGEVADRDQFHFSEIVLEKIPENDVETVTLIKSLLDQMANAAGSPVFANS